MLSPPLLLVIYGLSLAVGSAAQKEKEREKDGCAALKGLGLAPEGGKIQCMSIFCLAHLPSPWCLTWSSPVVVDVDGSLQTERCARLSPVSARREAPA